jgi:hypothetical protein
VVLGGLGLGIYIEYILQRGFKVDAFDPIPEINILDSSHAVFNTLPEGIPGAVRILTEPRTSSRRLRWFARVRRKLSASRSDASLSMASTFASNADDYTAAFVIKGHV